MNRGARMGTQLAGLVCGEYPPLRRKRKMGELGELARPRVINENG
jgi:hypothetical protein